MVGVCVCEQWEGLFFERVQFEGNEVGFQAPIGPGRMFFFPFLSLFFFCKTECKVRVGVGAYLCILMIGMSV